MDRLQVSKRHTTFSNMTSTYLQPFERYTIKIGEKKVLSLELLQLLNRSSDQFVPKNKFFLHKMDNNHASLFFFYCPRFSRKKKKIFKNMVFRSRGQRSRRRSLTPIGQSWTTSRQTTLSKTEINYLQPFGHQTQKT